MRFSRIRRLASVDIKQLRPQSLLQQFFIQRVHSHPSACSSILPAGVSSIGIHRSSPHLRPHCNGLSGNLYERNRVQLLACLSRLSPFAPAAFTAFITTMASADFCSPLNKQISPGKVHGLSGRAAGLYPMCLSVTVGFCVS